MFMIEIIAAVVGLLAILSVWQRHVDRGENARKLAELRDSVDRGTHKGIAQYPQIKPYLCIGCGSCIEACPEDNVLGLVNGIAHVINGNRCVGHGRCQDVCPVGAITVGLGDLKTRPDIPVLTEQLETSVSGIFIAGELGGMALIRHAIDQGTRAVDAIAKKMGAAGSKPASDILDLLIVGAGPSGLAASLRAQERKLRFATISQDDIGGTIRKYPRRKLTLVQDVDIPLHGHLKGREYSKEEIVDLWNHLIQKHHIAVSTGVSLTSVSRTGDSFEIQTTTGPMIARYLLLALGRRGTPRKLGVPGEELEKVLYQLIDTASYQNQKILIVGGGDSAIEAATGLANQRGNAVTLSYRKDAFTRLKSRNVTRLQDYVSKGRVKTLLSSEVEAIEPQFVTLKVAKGGRADRLRIPNDYVFIFAGGDPPFALLKQMGIRFGGETTEEWTGHARFA